MAITNETPLGVGWSTNGKRFYPGPSRFRDREPDHDDVVDAVAKLFDGRVRPGRIKIGTEEPEDGCFFSFFSLLDMANDLADLPPRLYETCLPVERVNDSHIHDACLKLGIPIWWVDREFAPLIEGTFHGVRFDESSRRFVLTG